jgi:hypothetical protein
MTHVIGAGQAPHMHDHMTLIEVTAQAEGDETVADHFAFDYEAVAAKVQLVGNDLFGVLAPRCLAKARPLRPHQWTCATCGFKGNRGPEQAACSHCTRRRDPDWLHIGGCAGAGSKQLDVGSLLDVVLPSGAAGVGGVGGGAQKAVAGYEDNGEETSSLGTPAVVTRIDRLKQSVTLHVPQDPAAAAAAATAAASTHAKSKKAKNAKKTKPHHDTAANYASEAAAHSALRAVVVTADALPATVLASHEPHSARGAIFRRWFHCAECGLLSQLANGQVLFLTPVALGTLNEQERRAAYELERQRAARAAGKAAGNHQAVLDANGLIGELEREIAALEKQLEKPQPWCVHCGWDVSKPTTRPGYKHHHTFRPGYVAPPPEHKHKKHHHRQQ